VVDVKKSIILKRAIHAPVYYQTHCGNSLLMDFFGNQDAARRKTGILIVYFLLAIICMIGALYTVVVLACS